MTTTYSPSLLSQMRSWVMDCSWLDVENDSDVNELSDAEILRGVARHYGGGLEQFVKDSEPVKVL